MIKVVKPNFENLLFHPFFCHVLIKKYPYPLFYKKNFYFKTYMQILEIIRTFMSKMNYSLNKIMKKVKFINMRIILSPLTFFS